MRFVPFCLWFCLLAQEQQHPDLTEFSPSNWGTITYDRASGKFIIDGHPQWYATGHVRKDGKVFILWTWRATQEPCPGVYEIKAGKFEGVWGYSSSCQVDGDGNLVGSIMGDRIYKVEK